MTIGGEGVWQLTTMSDYDLAKLKRVTLRLYICVGSCAIASGFCFVGVLAHVLGLTSDRAVTQCVGCGWVIGITTLVIYPWREMRELKKERSRL